MAPGHAPHPDQVPSPYPDEGASAGHAPYQDKTFTPNRAPYTGQTATSGHTPYQDQGITPNHPPYADQGTTPYQDKPFTPNQAPYPDRRSIPGHPSYAGQTATPGRGPYQDQDQDQDQDTIPNRAPHPAHPFTSPPAAASAEAASADARMAGFPAGELLVTPRPAARRGFVKIGAVTAVAVSVVVGGTAGAIAMTGGSDPAGSTATATAGRPSAAELKNAETERLRLSAQRASRAARRDFVRRPALAPKGTPLPGDAGAGNPVPKGEAQEIAKALLPKYGFDPDTQFGCLVELWDHESHWRTTAGSPDGPYGIPQANPGSKMASAGPNWQNDATTQIKWGLSYIKGRYDGPCDAWATFKSRGWY